MIFRKPKDTSPAEMMRAVEIARTDGGGGILYATHTARPAPQAGEVLVKVAYAGINRADLMQVAGSYLPPDGASPLPGLEVSGTIAQLGAGVVGWSAGEEVCALLSGGGYAEYVCVPAGQLLPLPPMIGLREAASLPEAMATAYMALIDSARLKPGERVLIHGGASGVGLMLVQVAGVLGAEVFATAGGPAKCAFVQALGAHAIDHQTGPFVAQVMQRTQDGGVDVIIDILGAPALPGHLKLLRPGGRLVSLAMLEGSVVESLRMGGVLMKNLTLTGTTLRNKTLEEKAEIIRGVKKRIWPHLATGAIKAYIDSEFPLEAAQKAHARMQERLHCGKILLEVAPN